MNRSFTPVRVGRYTTPNRLVMAPMTRSRAKFDGTPVVQPGYSNTMVVKKNGGEVGPRRRDTRRCGLNSHPDVEYVRKLCQRQRRRADDGGDQRLQGTVAAALAAHLACDPFQHFGIDADRMRWRPAFERYFRRQRNGARRHRQAGL